MIQGSRLLDHLWLESYQLKMQRCQLPGKKRSGRLSPPRRSRVGLGEGQQLPDDKRSNRSHRIASQLGERSTRHSPKGPFSLEALTPH